jgi:hypothetical protein
MSSEPNQVRNKGGGPVRANLPDKLVGIGGAGKTIVKEFMRQDWVLEEALEPRDDTGGDPPSEGIEAYLVDTATGQEKNEDTTDVDNLNALIRSTAADYGIREDQVLTNVQYINPFESTSPRYRRLTTTGPVRDIMQSRNLGAWWLENNDDMIVDDYSEGVIRRRALSKAVFQASQMQSGALGDLTTPSTADDAAVVVALGGGTGSGLFIDLAEELNEVVENVNLYAIIPRLTEEKELRANAYAALSELEHLALTNQSPFKSVVLLPFGPTEQVDQMQEFYDGVTNTIVAHYNMRDNQPDRLDENSGGGFGAPDYAPFTVAVPQTLRFEVGDIRTARDKVESFVEERLEALEREHELYDALEQFVLDQFAGEPPAENLEAALDANGGTQPSEGFNLSRDTAGDLRERLDDLTRLLDLQVLHQLDNEAADAWRERLQQRIQKEQASYDGDLSDAERNEMIVTNVAGVVYALDALEEEGYRDDSEQRLAEFVRDELRALLRRANLFRTASIIDDPAITEAIENALHEDRSALAGGDSASRKSQTYARAVDNTETNIDLLSEYIADELDPLVEQRVDEWRQTARQPLRQLATLEESRDRIDDLLGELEGAIEQAVVEIREANSAQAIDRDPLRFAKFDELNEHLEAVGIDPIDSHRIRRSLRNSARAHEVWLGERDQGLLSSINPFGSDDPEGDYFGHRNSIDDTLISIPETFDPDLDFEIRYVGDIGERADRIDDQRDDLIGDIVGPFERALGDPGVSSDEFAAALESEWQSEIAHRSIDDLPTVDWPGDTDDAVERLRERLRREATRKDPDTLLDDLCAPDDRDGPGIIYRGFFASVVEPVEEVKQHLEEHLESLEEEQQRYSRVVTINNEEGAIFAEAGTEPGRPDTAYDQRADTEFQYVKQVAPEDPHRLLSKDDILDAELWERENFTIESTLTNDFVPNITGLNRRLPLATGRIEGPSDDLADPFYTHHRLINVFLSRAFTGKKDDAPSGTDVFDSIETGIRRGIHVPNGDDGYTEAWAPFGAPWDVSMVTFLGGVFLDNIGLVSSDNGYKVAYEDQREELRESVRVRHSHGLDGTDDTLTPDSGTGAYIFRDDILQLSSSETHDTIVRKNEAELVELFESMQQVVRFPTSIARESDDAATDAADQRAEDGSAADSDPASDSSQAEADPDN